MVDRVSLSITLGGDLSAALRDDLLAIVQSEGLALDYDAEPFTADDFPADGPLSLYAQEVAWGRVDRLEGFCVAHGLPFARWSGGSAAQFGPERAVFIGTGEVRLYGADEDDDVVITMDRAKRLGSYEAIMAYFTAANFCVPPLRFVARLQAGQPAFPCVGGMGLLMKGRGDAFPASETNNVAVGGIAHRRCYGSGGPCGSRAGGCSARAGERSGGRMDEPYRNRANPRVRLAPPGRQDRKKADGHGPRFADGKAAVARAPDRTHHPRHGVPTANGWYSRHGHGPAALAATGRVKCVDLAASRAPLKTIASLLFPRRSGSSRPLRLQIAACLRSSARRFGLPVRGRPARCLTVRTPGGSAARA